MIMKMKLNKGYLVALALVAMFSIVASYALAQDYPS